eukprot:1159548-Pelagomonas_calceolata.AAC.14
MAVYLNLYALLVYSWAQATEIQAEDVQQIYNVQQVRVCARASACMCVCMLCQEDAGVEHGRCWSGARKRKLLQGVYMPYDSCPSHVLELLLSTCPGAPIGHPGSHPMLWAAAVRRLITLGLATITCAEA